jgi:hypothetical protein
LTADRPKTTGIHVDLYGTVTGITILGRA